MKGKEKVEDKGEVEDRVVDKEKDEDEDESEDEDKDEDGGQDEDQNELESQGHGEAEAEAGAGAGAGAEDKDVLMVSPPPQTPPRLEGSSRVTGGFSQGNAYGNVFNLADADDVVMENVVPVEGKVLLYFSNQNPSDINLATLKPSASFKHQVVPTIKPVLKEIASRFSPVKSKLI